MTSGLRGSGTGWGAGAPLLKNPGYTLFFRARASFSETLTREKKTYGKYHESYRQAILKYSSLKIQV